jgi:hypothetical protein
MSSLSISNILTWKYLPAILLTSRGSRPNGSKRRERWNSMTTMTRGLAAPRRAVQAATPCVDTVKTTRVEQMDGRMATDAGHDERTALRREFAWVQAAANATFRARV